MHVVSWCIIYECSAYSASHSSKLVAMEKRSLAFTRYLHGHTLNCQFDRAVSAEGLLFFPTGSSIKCDWWSEFQIISWSIWVVAELWIHWPCSQKKTGMDDSGRALVDLWIGGTPGNCSRLRQTYSDQKRFCLCQVMFFQWPVDLSMEVYNLALFAFREMSQRKLQFWQEHYCHSWLFKNFPSANKKWYDKMIK